MNKEIYRIFSLIFHRPEREFTRYLRNGFMSEIGFLDGDAIAGFSNFLEKNKGKTDENFYDALAVEYTRLFITAFPEVPCPPYESIYREDAVMGNTTLEVIDSYGNAGLKVLEEFHDLPDHVAVELEFLYYLMNKGDTERHDSFIRQHFSKWVPEFCEDVEKNDRIGFYMHTASILKNLINKEEWKNSMR